MLGGGPVLQRLLGFSLLLVSILAFSGCSTLGIGMSGTERIQRSGTLRVGMAGDYPPMNARTMDGQLIGLDADLAAALASILQVKLELVEMPFGELLEAVRDGRVDIAISGITMTPRRNLQVAFAGPYYVARKAILGKPEMIMGIDQVGQLRGRNLRIAALAGGTSEQLVRSQLPNATHLFRKNQDDAVALVLSGEADLMIADDPVIRFALLRYPDAGLTFVESRFTAEPIGIAISPDDHLFVNLVQNYLRNLEQIGLLTLLRAKWFEETDWIGILP
jgi:polar amino acid transport system substrate-binding protein